MTTFPFTISTGKPPQVALSDPSNAPIPDQPLPGLFHHCDVFDSVAPEAHGSHRPPPRSAVYLAVFGPADGLPPLPDHLSGSRQGYPPVRPIGQLGHEEHIQFVREPREFNFPTCRRWLQRTS